MAVRIRILYRNFFRIPLTSDHGGDKFGKCIYALWIESAKGDCVYVCIHTQCICICVCTRKICKLVPYIDKSKVRKLIK